MKSSLKNMVLVLLAITLVSSAAVGYVYSITEEPIAKAKAAKVTEALAEVLPEFDATEVAEVEMDGLPIKVYTATKGGEVSGYAVETMTKQGFGGAVKLMVGFNAAREVYNIAVLEQNETPGLGTKMTDEGNPLKVSFVGKNPADMTLAVKKDGGDVDALTAATISSRAYVDAVARAYNAMQQVAGGEKVDSATGATATMNQETPEEGQAQEGGNNE